MADKTRKAMCLEIVNAFEGLVQEHGGDTLLQDFRSMSREDKMSLADEIFETMKDEVRRAKLTVSAQDALSNYLTANGKDKKALVDLFSGAGVRGSGVLSLERRADAILKQFESSLAKGLERYRPRGFGLIHSIEGQRNIIRELYLPGSSGDRDAAQFMKAYREAHELLRLKFNNAGGNIKNLPDYHIPQYHDPTRIGRTLKKEWINYVKDLIDINRVQYHVSVKGGEVPTEVVDNILGNVYDNLASGGILHKEIAANPHVRSYIGKHHQQHRILHFKDADSWMKYADKYGASDYVQSLHSQAEIMSKEIAAMEIFGPNPDQMVRWLRREIQKEAGNKEVGALSEIVYDQIMGRLYTNNTRLADVMRGIRNVSVGLKIGKAVISAISDNYFIGATLFHNGLPMMKSYMNILGGLVNNAARSGAAH